MKLLFGLFLTLSTAPSFATNYYPTNIAQDFSQGMTQDEDLKDLIFKVLTMKHVTTSQGDVLVSHCGEVSGRCYSQKTLGYKTAKKILFGKLHSERVGNSYVVKDVYCGKEIHRGEGTKDRLPKNSVMNCEHTWPQSKFNRDFAKAMQRADLHHLYPSDSRANSKRGNHPFGEVRDGKATKGCEASRYGKINNRFFFEPPAEHKGNVARAMFYFAVRYKMKMNNQMEQYLRIWHEEDPVDAQEAQRNDLIHQIQGNRNPFIDYPRLVNSIRNF